MNYDDDSDEVYGPSLKEHERDDKQFDQYNMFRFQDMKAKPKFDPLRMGKAKVKPPSRDEDRT